MPKHPHIIKFCSDEHSPFVCGYAADPWVRTPNLDRLAAGGVSFENCYCANPICVPGRYSMLSGNLPRENGTPFFHSVLPLETQTYMRHFSQHGYHTTCSGKMHFQGPEQMYGWMFRPYGDMEVMNHSKIPGYDKSKDVTGGNPDTMPKVNCKDYGGQMPYMVKTARAGDTGFMLFDESVTREAVLHLKDYFEVLIHLRYQGERPLLFEVSYKTPHWPFIAPKELFDYYRQIVELPENRLAEDAPPMLRGKSRSDQTEDITEDQILNARAAYWGLVEWMDMQIGIVLQALDEIGILDESIIMYTSDHGEMAGERDMWGKHCFYEESVRVPMIVSGPGIPKGRKVRENVSHMDMFPTMAELAGLPLPQNTRGESLVPYLNGKDTVGERVVHSELFHGQRVEVMAKKGDAKLIEYPDGNAQLFDLAKDPKELNNLIADESYSQVRSELSRSIAELPAPWCADEPEWEALGDGHPGC